MSDPVPVPFLLQPDTSKPATVTTDNLWSQIFTKSKLAKGVTPTGTSPDGDVAVTFKDESSSPWNLQFSSVGNEAYFGLDPSSDRLLNHAWVGDEFNSAVMVLSSTQSTTGIFTNDIPLARGDDSVFKALGINSSANNQLTDFLKVVDPALLGPLTVKLQPPTHPGNPNPSALYCTTTIAGYQTCVRLEYVISTKDSPIDKVVTWIHDALGLDINITVPDIQVTATKTITYPPNFLDDSTQIPVEEWTVSFQMLISSFKVALDFSDGDTVCYLVPIESISEIATDLDTALGNTVGLDKMPTQSDPQFAKLIGNHIDLWYVKIEKDFADPSSKLSWGVGILAGWTIGSDNIPVLVGLTYESRVKTFHGRLILKTDPLLSHLRYPDYDYRISLPKGRLLTSQQIDVDKIDTTLDLWKLFTGDSGTPPKELTNIPFKLAGASVTYQSFSDDPNTTGSTASFFLDITAHGDPAAPSNTTAPSGFTWDEISVFASRTAITNKATHVTDKTTAMQIYSAVSLNPVHDTSIPPATLDVNLSYNSTGGASDWMLQGSMSNLSVALLADVFFDTSCATGAMAVLGKLTLTELDIFYTYTSGQASSFLISAIITLGELELDLSYQYISTLHSSTSPVKPTAASLKWGDKPPHAEVTKLTPDPAKNRWTFEAFLRVSDQSSTIASIANSIVPNKGDDLPSFVGDIEVSATGDPLNAPIKLIYTGDDVNGSILAVWLSIKSFNMTFIQYRPKGTAAGDKTPKVKQILRISCDQIPMLDKVPLVNQLPQPFDHLIYLWVDDPDQTDKNLKGFTRETIDKAIGSDKAINHALAEVSIPEIMLKESKSTNPTDLVLVAGHHFIVVTDNKVVLDHVFEHDPKTAAATSQPTAPLAPIAPAATVLNTGTISAVATTPPPKPVVTGPESPPTKGDSNTKAGPLSISALTVQYKNGSLFVGIDATLVLGPLTFSVIGFTLEIKLSQVRLNDLAALITNGLTVSIHGLEAGVNKEPLTLKGVFIHDVVPSPDGDVTTESYRGGIAVGFKAWKVLAVGEYAIVSTKSTNSEFKSVFVYGKLDGPLVTLEFATISGVRLGFGYNSLVHLPTADKLYQFPFISDTATGDDPLAVLNAMEGGTPPFVYKKLGGVWFAAGMTITCFDCISLTAVLMFEIETKSDQNGVIIALLADGVFQMEPLAPPDLSLFYVELLIKVELNFIEGYIAADAALSPASHVYVPSAHLTGSGSFYTWFPPSAHAGDWVVTIGGYHRAYNPPDHYPHNLVRLGLNFTVGNAVHVVGGAYVAVTPKCAMAGGQLHISVDVGPVSAYADIALDVFINFKPFYFIAEIRLSVGVDCDVDLGLISFHISISLSADLTLWGPDSFGGTAYVDFWFFGFSIDFGSGLRDPPGIPLIEFYDIVRTAGPNSDPPKTDTTTSENPYQAQHKYSIEDGLFPNKPKTETPGEFPNTGATIEWKVLAGPLQIRIDCDFALSNAYLTTSKGDVPIQEEIELNPIFSFPMHNIDAIESKLWIAVYDLEGGEAKKQLIDDFQAELVLKQAPKATWTKYTSDNDPLSRISGGKRNKPSALQDGSEPTLELCQGVRLYPPVAKLSQSPVADFDATAAMLASEDVLPIRPSAPQTTLLSSPFEPEKDSVSQWSDFASVFTGATDATVIDTNNNTFTKADMRGDAAIDAGMLGLLVATLGWKQRGPLETVAGVVPDKMIPDPNDATKTVVQRKEWELIGTPPALLAEELGYYYPYLPMVTAAA